MTRFDETVAGQTFFNKHVPDFLAGLAKLNENLAKLNNNHAALLKLQGGMLDGEAVNQSYASDPFKDGNIVNH